MNQVHGKLKQRDRGLYSLLSQPVFYEVFNNILGQRSAWRRYVQEFVAPEPGMKILDVGCGPGTVLEYLPGSLEYVGFDVEPNCIAHAQAKYGHRGKFFCQRVSEAVVEQRSYYDVVMANSVLHHLDDEEATVLFDTAHKALGPGKTLVTFDPVFIEQQHWIARQLISRDRGLFVRKADGYLTLARRFFPNAEGTVVHDLYRVPYTIFVMRCRKA